MQLLKKIVLVIMAYVLNVLGVATFAVAVLYFENPWDEAHRKQRLESLRGCSGPALEVSTAYKDPCAIEVLIDAPDRMLRDPEQQPEREGRSLPQRT